MLSLDPNLTGGELATAKLFFNLGLQLRTPTSQAEPVAVAIAWDELWSAAKGPSSLELAGSVRKTLSRYPS